MNQLGTIVQDFSNPYMDKQKRESSKRLKGRPRNWKYKYEFAVNPLWKKAYTGRSEYNA